MKRFFIAAAIAVVMTSCISPLKLQIKFNGETKLMPRSSVMNEDTVIGEVSKVEYDGEKTIVTAVIKPEYRNRMTKSTMFFRVAQRNEERVMVLFFDNRDGEQLEDGEIVNGGGDVMYYALRAGKGITEKIKEFFKSDEWKEFRDEISEKVKKSADATKEELDRETYEIRREAEEFINEMKEKYGDDLGKRVKEFTDSLIEELKINE